ncbi:MAG: protein kinase [Gemmatimonadetes bacterium]|nr:protein kinase [Gemmatimonadota bacterium]
MTYGRGVSAAHWAMASGPHHLVDDTFLALQEALAGRYSLESELGRGGMGLVYRAREVRLDRPVAIKLLRPDLASRSDIRERFLREARTAAQLYHPNIVPIHLADEVDGMSFFVMACVDGETLAQRIERKGPMAPEEAARLLRSIAWALAYAHARGVVHRDIKPENILIDRESRRPLVADFGIAQVSRIPGGTMAGEIVGTPEFMSPEQCAGDDVDGRSDIYSLGIIGYYVLTGTVPFTGPDIRSILTRHIATEPRPLTELRRDLPPQLATTLSRCLAKDREARFATAEALAQALEESMGTARRVPLPIRTYLRRFRRPQWEMLLLASVACAAAFGIGQMVLRGRGGLTNEALIAGGALGLAWLAFTEFRETRALVRAGYGHADLMRALRAERDAERREIWASSDDPAPDLARIRVMRAVFVAGVLATVASLAGAVLMQPGLTARQAMTQMPLRFVVPLALAVIIAIAGGARLILARATLFGDVAIRLWDSRLMRGAFVLAGMGAERSTEYRADRPTEVAVGSAVMALLDSLQPTMASELGEIAELSQGLEDRARRLRGEMMQHPSLGLEGQLGDTVAVLEEFRIGLLRLRGPAPDRAGLDRAIVRAQALLGQADGAASGLPE